nr:reverse transcriptase domain-containing protein [Tanacetum cinerariifolium]
MHGFGHLEEIVVKRADQQLYKFKEGNFVDPQLNDIKDMLLLVVQHKLFYLNDSDIVDFIVALRIPPGVFYEDLNKQKRVMWADELYKFSDGTLKNVQDELHQIILDFRLAYNKEMLRRKWTAIGRKRSQLVVELIDKQIRKRRIIRNLERMFPPLLEEDLTRLVQIDSYIVNVSKPVQFPPLLEEDLTRSCAGGVAFARMIEIWLLKTSLRSDGYAYSVFVDLLDRMGTPTQYCDYWSGWTTYLKNEISRFTQRFKDTFEEAWERFKEMLRACPHHGFSKLTQIDTFYNGLNEQDQDSLNASAGGNLLTTGTYNQVSSPNQASNQMAPPGFAPVQNNQNRGDFNKQEENIRKNLNSDMRSILGSFFQNQASTSGTLPSNTIPNPKGEIKVVTTCSGLAYEGPSLPTNSFPEKVVEQEIEETTDREKPNCQRSTAHIQPPVVPTLIPEPDVPKTQPKPNIPYPSRLNDQKLREKPTNQMEKFFQIFHDLHFDISFADALLLMPKFASTIKIFLTNKDKLFELSKVPLNENCSAMLLKKLPEKLRDPDKFLFPCDFLGIDVCHALADLGASINLMPLSIWKKLSLPELTLTRMTLELADRSITRPKGVSEDVFVKVRKFYFPTDFVVVDFEADPRVLLILGRSFLRSGRALIDVFGEEVTLRVNDESVTFNLNQTMRYFSTYDNNSVNRVDVIDIACDEYALDVLDFKYNSKSGNPILVSNPSFSEETKSEFCKGPIVKSSSPTLTPFGESDFFLEEIKDFIKDESIPTGIKYSCYDSEGDILYLEKLLSDDPSQLPPMDLKQAEETKAKSLIEDPSKLELKELPSHLEYTFLEETDKLPVIIAKDLKNDDKEALLKVLKSQKRAIAWKITDIKGIDPGFCTHKILMKEDYKPVVQSQRRVNSKIHE